METELVNKGNMQFSRYVEVEFRNFKNQTLTRIGNEFEIEFEYFKSLDQTQEDDTGKILIYGLTPETVKSLQQEGSEVVLNCGYFNSEISTLFLASVVRVYSNTRDNISVTTIECSANMLNYYITGTVKGNTISYAIEELSDALGASSISMTLPENISPENRNIIKAYFDNAKYNLLYVGSMDKMLKQFTEDHYLTYRKDTIDSGGFRASFTLSDSGVTHFLNEAKTGFDKVNSDSTKFKKLEIEFQQSSPESSDTITFLNNKTGLIESKEEWKVSRLSAEQALSENEVETLQSQQARLEESERRATKAQKDAVRAQRAKDKGKEFKPSRFTEKRDIIVNRRYNKVKALLNPNVKPQSIVGIEADFGKREDESEVVSISDVNRPIKNNSQIKSNEKDALLGDYSLFRVRNATYKGNNKNNDWIMDLYCEDTSSSQLTKEEQDYLNFSSSSEDINTDGLEQDETDVE